MTTRTGQDRAAHAQQILASVEEARAELSRADTKAGTLLTLVTGALAGLLAFAQSTRIPTAANALLWLSAAAAASAAVLLLLVIRPWLGDSAGILGDHAELLDLEPADLTVWHRRRLVAMSGAALAKHRSIRRCVHLLLGSLALLMLAVVITAAARMAAPPPHATLLRSAR